MIDRRSFLTSATVLAAAGAMRPTIAALQPKGPPRLRFGILSDIHITDEASTGPFEKALRKFDEWKADGVIACGDLADWGVIPQLERVAATWFKVFPGGRRSDGAKVENLMHYGDHDTSGYFYRGNPGCVKTYPDVEKMKKDIIPLGDRKAIWENAFKEEWAPIVHTRVKGYDFILSHFTRGEKGNEWGDNVPGLEEFFEKLAPKLEKNKPFFYSQHRIPRGTVGNEYLYGQDDGSTTKLFSKYPDLMAFCGHAHLACFDEQALWQGAFTCLQVPSLSYNTTQGGRDNGYASATPWKSPRWQMQFFPLGHTKQGLFAKVYDNAIVISRHDFRFGQILGPDWVIPLPLSGDRPFAYARRAQTEPVPVFPDGAEVSVTRRMKKDRTGKERDIYEVTFPAAVSKVGAPRAHDYEVQIETFRRGIGKIEATKRVFSTRCMFGEGEDLKTPVVCDFDVDCVPDDLSLRFIARPLNAFGRRGEEISVTFPAGKLPKALKKTEKKA